MDNGPLTRGQSAQGMRCPPTPCWCQGRVRVVMYLCLPPVLGMQRETLQLCYLKQLYILQQQYRTAHIKKTHGTSNDFTFLSLLWLLIMNAVTAAKTTSSFRATEPVHVSATSSSNAFLTTMTHFTVLLEIRTCRYNMALETVYKFLYLKMY